MLDGHGKLLVEYILQAIAGASPRSHLDQLTNVLFTLNKNCVTQLSAWLQVHVCSNNFGLLFSNICVDLGITSARELSFSKCYFNR